MKGRICAMAETWILYRTENLVNGKIYVGVHKIANTKHSRDYLGSGKALKTAIEKYGRENFTRITLAEFSCADDAYLAEADMVNEDFIERDATYNMKCGGRGGIGWKPTEETRIKMGKSRSGKTHTEETKARMRLLHIGETRSPETKAKISAKLTGVPLSAEAKAKISSRLIGNKYNLGKNHTEETKTKLSEMMKGNKYSVCAAIFIDDKYYSSIALASRTEQIPCTTIKNRLKSTNSQFAGYRYATDAEKLQYNASAL